jgi:uncharacterized membrane protein
MIDTPVSKREIKFAWLFIILSSAGLYSSFAIFREKIALLTDTSYIATCDYNSIIQCGAVIRSMQESVFGFPNAILGLIGFTVILMIGVSLLSGAHFSGWFWKGLMGVFFLTLLFVHWLIFTSIFIIEALCIFCLVIWIITIALFVSLSDYVLKLNVFGESLFFKKMQGFLQRYGLIILGWWYFVIAGVIVSHFWEYFHSLL